MRFQKNIKNDPIKFWTEEETREKISAIRQDIAEFNQEMNKIDSEINELKNRKGIIQQKVTRKWVYLRQLQNQIGEIKKIKNHVE